MPAQLRDTLLQERHVCCQALLVLLRSVCWMLSDVVECFWKLMDVDVVGCCWMPGCCQMLTDAIGCCGHVVRCCVLLCIVVTRCCWMLLDVAGAWMLPDVVGHCLVLAHSGPSRHGPHA